MHRLQTLLRTLRLRLFGPQEPDGVNAFVTCVHTFDYCGWRQTPKGKWGWWAHCIGPCGQWFAC